MGSSLGPAFANIFVGYYESKLFDSFREPLLYYRYMDEDDTFVVFDNEGECDLFLKQLNSLYLFLQFTFKKECNQSLPFLDVMVEKAPLKFVTSVYRKPTFTSQCIRWNSFNSQKRKTNLISTLTHRVLYICPPEKLQDELESPQYY